MPTRPVPQLAIDFLQKVEGCRLTSYQDSGGVWTNGYGHTRGVAANSTISQAIAYANLIGDADDAADLLETRVHDIASLTDHEYAALISFVFNLGDGPNGDEWTIFKDVNAGNMGDVPTQMLRFDHGRVDGQLVEIPGLKNRRMAEIALWNTADVEKAAALATPDIAPSSGYTRVIATPPVPTPPPPGHKASLVAKAAGGISAVGAAASQMHGIIAPHAGESHVYQQIAVALTGVIIVASVVALYIHGAQFQAALQ